MEKESLYHITTVLQ